MMMNNPSYDEYDDDESIEDESDHVSVSEIHQQRKKLLKRAATPAQYPGAMAVDDMHRSSKSNKEARSSASASSNRERRSGESRRNKNAVRATAVNAQHSVSKLEKENKRMRERLQEMKRQNQLLQQQQQEETQLPAPTIGAPASKEGMDAVPVAEVVPVHDSKSSASPNRCKLWTIAMVLVVLAVGGTVAGLLLGGSKDADDTEEPLETITTPNSPTLSPTTAELQEDLKYIPPSPNDCTAIVNGDIVTGQENFSTRKFTVTLDVSLVLDTDPSTLDSVLEVAIQTYMVPELAGCGLDPVPPGGARRRRLQGVSSKLHRRMRALQVRDYSVANAVSTVSCETDVPCNNDAIQPCYRCLVDLVLWVRGDETEFEILPVLAEAIEAEKPLVDLWRLETPFDFINAILIEPTSSEQQLSDEPTEDPSKNPTNLQPVTSAPTTPDPTPAPTAPAPTAPAPTASPTSSPTLMPTTMPTAMPKTPLPTPPPPTARPTETVECPIIRDYFEGPFAELEKGLPETIYSIGCKGFPTTIVAISPVDDSSCVQCLGSLVAAQFRAECAGPEATVVNFKLPAIGDDGQKTFFGYAQSPEDLDCESLIKV